MQLLFCVLKGNIFFFCSAKIKRSDWFVYKRSHRYAMMSMVRELNRDTNTEEMFTHFKELLNGKCQRQNASDILEFWFSLQASIKSLSVSFRYNPNDVVDICYKYFVPKSLFWLFYHCDSTSSYRYLISFYLNLELFHHNSVPKRQ
jgi:hypothetical protein